MRPDYSHVSQAISELTEAGAAAALAAAAHSPKAVSAVVSRGGRPDMAGAALKQVRAPALLIVGGADGVVVGLNEDAARLLTCKWRMEQVVDLAGDWFDHRLNPNQDLANG